MKYLSLLPVLLLITGLSAGAPAAFAAKEGTTMIKKCQDAQGRWHFGDRAAEECERSKVIEMSGQGVKKKEIAAPPTAEEMKQQDLRRAEQERERERSEQQKRRDELLLSSYGTEADISYVRDRKLAQIDATIQASEGTLSALRVALTRMEGQFAEETKKGDKKAADQSAKSIEQTKAQIARHEATIAAKQAEKDTIRKLHDEEVVRYRELKSRSPATPAPAGRP